MLQKPAQKERNKKRKKRLTSVQRSPQDPRLPKTSGLPERHALRHGDDLEFLSVLDVPTLETRVRVGRVESRGVRTTSCSDRVSRLGLGRDAEPVQERGSYGHIRVGR